MAQQTNYQNLFPNSQYVVVPLNGAPYGHDGDPDTSGVDSFVIQGRAIIETTGMPSPPGAGGNAS